MSPSDGSCTAAPLAIAWGDSWQSFGRVRAFASSFARHRHESAIGFGWCRGGVFGTTDGVTDDDNGGTICRYPRGRAGTTPSPHPLPTPTDYFSAAPLVLPHGPTPGPVLVHLYVMLSPFHQAHGLSWRVQHRGRAVEAYAGTNTKNGDGSYAIAGFFPGYLPPYAPPGRGVYKGTSGRLLRAGPDLGRPRECPCS